jgi:2-methylfumaryl-CoA isomerase
VAAAEEKLGADFTDEGQRYQHRDVLDPLFAAWFRTQTAEQITAALSATSVLWERYRTFDEVIGTARVTDNPLFTALDQPGIGSYLAPGLPMSVGGAHTPAAAAPVLGEHTAAVLAGRLGMSSGEIAALVEQGVVKP